MDFIRIIWDYLDDPDGNVQHVAEHGLDIENVGEVLAIRRVKEQAIRPEDCAYGVILWKTPTLL